MVDQFGLDVVRAYMNHVQDNAEESVRRVISRLKDGRFVYPMDDGFEIHVGVTVNHQDRTAKIDFTGTSGQHPTNYNAPKAVRSEEHTSELQSLMRISYAVLCLKQKTKQQT